MPTKKNSTDRQFLTLIGLLLKVIDHFLAASHSLAAHIFDEYEGDNESKHRNTATHDQGVTFAYRRHHIWEGCDADGGPDLARRGRHTVQRGAQLGGEGLCAIGGVGVRVGVKG